MTAVQASGEEGSTGSRASAFALTPGTDHLAQSLDAFRTTARWVAGTLGTAAAAVLARVQFQFGRLDFPSWRFAIAVLGLLMVAAGIASLLWYTSRVLTLTYTSLGEVRDAILRGQEPTAKPREQRCAAALGEHIDSVLGSLSSGLFWTIGHLSARRDQLSKAINERVATDASNKCSDAESDQLWQEFSLIASLSTRIVSCANNVEVRRHYATFKRAMVAWLALIITGTLVVPGALQPNDD
jgi:hypothetical protein